MRRRRPSLYSLRRMRRLIRFRLTFWYTGLVALVLVAFVGTVFAAFTTYQQSVEDYTSLLTNTFKQQVEVGVPPASLRNQGGDYNPYISGDYYALRLKDPDAASKAGYPMTFFDLTTGKQIGPPPANPVLHTQAAQKGQQTVASDASKGKTTQAVVTQDRGWRFITVPLSYAGDKVVGQIAVPTLQIEHQVDVLKRILVSAAAVLLLISAIGGWLLARRALAPIDAITRRAQRITAHDLSQRLAIEQEDELGRLAAAFDNMIGRLEAAFTRQQRFTSDASHELRTPLTVMQSEVEMALSRPRSNEAYRATLESVDEELGRLSALVNGLLALTRIDVDPAGLAHETVALDRLLDDLLERFRILAEDRGIALDVERLDEVAVNGDATRLRQLFGNILDNAMTYTPDGGRVSIALERTDEGARARVRDTGIGIDPEGLPRIFERFYRTDEARAHNAQGTGLGLAITQAVAQAHHGTVAVESTPGAGTTVTVVLPHDRRSTRRRGRSVRRLMGGGTAAR